LPARLEGASTGLRLCRATRNTPRAHRARTATPEAPMTVKATEWTMISDLSPESAYRETNSAAAGWRLSWLPERLLTREQAMAGMELDEILSDLDSVHDRHAHADAAILAGTVGIIWEEAVIRLSKR